MSINRSKLDLSQTEHFGFIIANRCTDQVEISAVTQLEVPGFGHSLGKLIGWIHYFGGV